MALLNSILGVATSLTNISSNFISWLVYGINYLISSIAGLVIVIETYLIGVILQLNGNVMKAFAVKAGFAVTLSIANLGFVLGIIVIALATILRQETYGIKNTLWKLVVAAILVNFSLVIGGAVINFGNQLTTTFMNNRLPGTGGFFSFASDIAGAFAPHRSFLVGSVNPDGSSVTSTASQSFLSGQATQFAGNILIPVLSILFTAAMMIVIVIVLAVFIFMLLIRYVYLTILLILMPFAWLLWIFPKTQQHWHKWWNEFIRWTFFAPIVVFFLWLSITTAGLMSRANSQPVTVGGRTPNDPAAALSGLGYVPSQTLPAPLAALSAAGGGGINTLIGSLVQMFVIVGLAIGGMIAANKLSITGAGAAVGAAKSMGVVAGNWTAKQGKKGGRWVARKAGVDRAVERMRSGNLGTIRGTPVAELRGGVGWAASRAASIIGRTVQPKLSNVDLVEQARKGVPRDPSQIRQNLAGNMNTQDNVASIMELVNQGELTGSEMVGKKTVKQYMDENKELFERGYGQGKLIKDADKALGSNKEMRDIEKELGGLAKGSVEYSNTLKKLDLATKAFVESLGKSDMSKMNVNDILSKDTDMSRAFVRNMARYAPLLVASAMPKMKSPTLKTYDKIFNEEVDVLISDPAVGIAEAANLKRLKSDFEKALNNNVLFMGSGSPASAPSAPPPTP